MYHVMRQWFKFGVDFCLSLASANRYTCNQNIEDCKNYKQWSTNPQTVREAFHEDSQCTLSFDNDSSSFLYEDDSFKSLRHDKDQMILKLKDQLKPYINDEELKTLLDPKSYTCENSDENNKSSSCTFDRMNSDCVVDKTISNEEVNNSLLNDMDKVIQGLTNRLKDFISCNEINKLLIKNFNLCDSTTVDHSSKISRKIISFIYDCIINIVVYILFCVFKSNCPSKQSSADKRIDKSMDNPDMICTQHKSQCQTFEKFTCGDDPTVSLIAQTRCTYEQHNYCKENARLKMLLKTLAGKLKRRENDLRQLVLNLRKLNKKLTKDPC